MIDGKRREMLYTSISPTNLNRIDFGVRAQAKPQAAL
jgi:hypothetical protein